jgi:hypothetical protein
MTTVRDFSWPKVRSLMMVLILVLFLWAQVIKVGDLKNLGRNIEWTRYQSNENDSNNKQAEEEDPSQREEEKEEEERDEEEDDEEEGSTATIFSHFVTTRIHINSPVFERQNIIMRRPTEDNTVIAFIAMGPHHTFLVHRAIRSL